MTSSEPSSPSQPLSNLAAALIKFHEAVPTIHDNSESHFGGFADLPGVLSKIGPALRTAGLVVSQLPENVDGQPGLRTTLLHTSGESLTSVTLLAVNAGRNATQEWGKAVTYQRRYALLAALGLCVGIVDNDADLNEGAKPATKVEHQQSTTIPGIPAEENKLSTKEVDELILSIKALNDGNKQDITTAFCFAFKHSEVKLTRDRISRRKHQTWIQDWLKAHHAR